MSGPRKQIDQLTLIEKKGEGKTLKDISLEMGVSIPTLSRRLAALHHDKGIFTKFPQLQLLQLTQLQARTLAAIDFDHIEKASLVDIANALYVITKIEIAMKEKESGKARGLVDHILTLKKHE